MLTPWPRSGPLHNGRFANITSKHSPFQFQQAANKRCPKLSKNQAKLEPSKELHMRRDFFYIKHPIYKLKTFKIQFLYISFNFYTQILDNICNGEIEKVRLLLRRFNLGELWVRIIESAIIFKYLAYFSYQNLC